MALEGGGRAAVAAAPAASGTGSGIDFEGITVAYRGQAVLKDLTLAVRAGEILALIGPSGSGKTTALRAVAGFVRPVAGRIHVGGKDVTDLPPYARDLGMVVQNYALFPHMKVAENVAFGLRARNAAEDLVQERVRECLRMVGMLDFVDRFPRQLSGGQQQRVAIARALAIRPRVLLLDEPLSALDAQIRRNMLEELARLHAELPDLTVLYVTHDQSEALTLAHRIAIMRDGMLAAHGPSRELYLSPPNRFAAEFLGRANLLPVTMKGRTADGRFARVRFGSFDLLARSPLQLADGTPCLLCVRPHDLAMGEAGSAGNEIRGRVQSILWQGEQQSLTIDVEGTLLRLSATPMAEPPARGEALSMSFASANAILIRDDER